MVARTRSCPNSFLIQIPLIYIWYLPGLILVSILHISFPPLVPFAVWGIGPVPSAPPLLNTSRAEAT